MKGMKHEVGEIKLRPEVAWFAEQMELALRKNDHKGGWSNCRTEYLLRRIKEEYGELVNECDAFDPDTWNNQGKLIKEAADVANFAMMIADNARKN